MYFNRLLLSCITIILACAFPFASISIAISPLPTKFYKEESILLDTQHTQENFLCPARITLNCFVTQAQNALAKISNQNSRDFAGLFLAIAQAEMLKKSSSLKTINSINNLFLQYIPLTTIAKLDARSGNSEQGKKTAVEILKHAGKSPQAYVNIWLNSLLAETFAELENYPQAQSLIDSALETIPLVSNYNTRAELFSLIGTAQNLIGNQSAAKTSLENAIAEAAKFTDPYLKSLALSHIGLAQFKLGQINKAFDTLVLAKRNAVNASPQSKIVALSFLAVVKARTNQAKSARKLIHETSNAAYDVKNPYYRALACTFLAQAMFIAENKST